MKGLYLAAVVFLVFTVHSIPVSAEEIDDRPKIGLALSGGGARGGAHVGILKTLEELNVSVDYIAGTSMGAIIGGFYAAGYSADEIEDFLETTDWKKALRDQPARKDRTMRKKELDGQFLIPYRVGFNKGKLQLPLGAIEGQHLDQIFHRILLPVVEVRDFGKLKVPFRAVATDLVTGEEVVLSQGSLPDALRASMSVPGVFAPVRHEGRMLVDGGMSNNLPVSVVRDMGADIVIAVDISTPLLTEEQLTSVLSVTEQLTNFLTRRNTQAQIESLGSGDILIVPELGDFSSTDFEGAREIVEKGAQAAMAQRNELAALAVDGSGRESSPKDWVERAEKEYIVHFVDIANDSVLNDEIIRSRLAVDLGQPLDLGKLEKSVDSIYSLDIFESVTYNLVKDEQGHQGLRIHAVPRDWGPNYLQFGLELANDFAGNSDFKLGAAYTRNALNSLGGELRTTIAIGREDELIFDFYQPIDRQAQWFIEPQLYWRRENYNYWENDIRVAELEISGPGGGIGIGRNFSTRNRLSLNYEFSSADAAVITGELGFPIDEEVDIGELLLDFRHDSLDSLYFPTSGGFHRLAYRHASESLGAAKDFEQFLATGSFVLSHGRNTALLNYEAGYSFDDAAPVERWFGLGGFGRMSGLAPNQLSGRQEALAVLAYYRRLNDIDFFPAYAGITLEAGNVWNSKDEMGFDDLRYSGSIFVGAETPLGPVYLAVGHSDNGDTAAYFYVGNPFRVTRFE